MQEVLLQNFLIGAKVNKNSIGMKLLYNSDISDKTVKLINLKTWAIIDDFKCNENISKI